MDAANTYILQNKMDKLIHKIDIMNTLLVTLINESSNKPERLFIDPETDTIIGTKPYTTDDR